MFKISFFVDDKNLPHVLRAVGGRVMDLSVVPVVNAVQETDKRGRPKPNGKLKQDAGHTLGLFCKELKKASVINVETAKAAATRAGGSATSYSYYLQQAVKANLIK